MKNMCGGINDGVLSTGGANINEFMRWQALLEARALGTIASLVR